MKTHTQLIGSRMIIAALLVLTLPLLASAGTIIFDEEAERAELDGMETDDRYGITHIYAENKYEGSATFTFTVDSPGIYMISGKTIATDKQHDSFYVSIDESKQAVWHVPRSERWQWNPMETEAAPDGEYRLSAGEHTLTLHGREVTRIDRVQIETVYIEETADEGSDTPEQTNDEENSDDSVLNDDEENSDDPVSNDDEDESTVEEESTPPEPANDKAVPQPEEDPEEPVEPDVPTDSTDGPVLYVATDGDNNDSGSKTSPLRTIQHALSLAEPGDTIVVRSGIYSEEIETVRAGTEDAPITLKAAAPGEAILDLDWDQNGPRFVHSHYRFVGFEVRNFDEGIRIEGAQNVALIGNEIHHGENECLRVRYFSHENIISNNIFHFCGATSPNSRIGDGNGEGIYIGTAPEQREKNGGEPDTSTGNIISGNLIYDVTEGVDIKEDSTRTVVTDNEIYDASDENSGAINVRGDENIIDSNHAHNNDGSGFRFGGDRDVEDPSGQQHDYGINNLVQNNKSTDNAAYGYKVMIDAQNADCSNGTEGNAGGDTNSGINWCFR